MGRIGPRLALRATLALLSAAAVVCPSARAAEPGLEECLERAARLHPDLAAMSAALEGARARRSRARAAYFGPVTYRQLLGVVNRARGTPLSSPDDKDELLAGLGPFTRVDLSINVPIFTFGQLGASSAAAEAGVEAAGAELRRTRAEVVEATRALYLGHLLAKELTGLLEERLTELDDAREKVKEKLAAGSAEVTELDALALELGRARLAKEVLGLSARREVSRLALARAVGAEDEGSFEIADGHLVVTSTTAGPGGGGDPRRDALAWGLRAARREVERETAALWPKLGLSAGLSFAWAPNRDRQDNPFAFDELNYVRPVLLLAATWDLDVWVARAKIAEKRAEVARLEARSAALESGLALELAELRAEQERARRTMELMAGARRAGRAMLVLATTNFDLGVGSAEVVFDALQRYTEASAEHLRAIHDLNLARGRLRALGAGEGP